MLEYLRNASEKPVAKILISILAFSFVGWGVAEWIFGSTASDNTLVRVGDTEISIQEFNLEKSRELAQLSKEEQRAIYTDAETQNKFLQQVLTKIATQQMTENRANDLGFMVSDKRIASEIRTFPEFQVNGEFSTLAFDTILNNSGYSEAQFAEVLRGNILRSMVLGAVGITVPTPEFAIRTAYDARYSERKIEYTTVKYSDFKVATPTDTELAEFYKQNPKIIPETRTVSYVIVPAEMSQPDKYDEGYAIAVKFEDDIIAGESMQEAAKKHNAKYIELGEFSRDNRPVDKILTDSMMAKIFDMETGLESEMIETKDGFVFVRVDKITPEHTATFESIKDTLVNDWKQSEQKKQAYVQANQILTNLKSNGTMPNSTTATVSRTSGAPTDILVAAFHGGIDKKSIVPSSDAFYVLNIQETISPQPDAKKMADLRTEMQNMSKASIIDDYNSFLMRQYPIEVNEKTFNRFFQN
ncbi:MAG: SurA N-terminal domain-containing protein [Alphaproteobacteria bacterium]|nr:SurA N-terminal domain-containing protein [Alphaproteobacteria bacterium]